MFALKEQLLESYRSNHLPVRKPKANRVALSGCPSEVCFSLTSQQPHNLMWFKQLKT